MTQRERYLAMGVGVVVGLFGLNYGFTSIREGLQLKQDQVDMARKESDNMKRIATSGALAARKLEQLKSKSLPTSQERLVAEYTAWLTRTAEAAGLADISVIRPEQPLKTTPAYKMYKFKLEGVCRNDQWLKLMASFYDADLLHSIHNLQVTSTKTPGMIKLSIDAHALALTVASPKQELSRQSSGRLAMNADEYTEKILGRNPFSPPNKPPKLALDKDTIEIPRGTPWNQIIKTEDIENHEVEIQLVSAEVPEGLKLSGKTLNWNPEANGTHEVVIKATDSGWPRASTEQRVTLRVVDPPAPKAPEPEPPKFDVATQAFVSAFVTGKAGPEVWVFSRVEGKKLELTQGAEFEIGSVKAKVVGLNSDEEFIELESDGVRWTIDMDTSLAEAYSKSKVD